MTDRNIFMETLHEVAEIVRTSAEAMSRDEILFYFKDMDLTKEQENMVIEYLLTPHDEEAVEEPEEPQAVEPSKAEPQELTDSRVSRCIWRILRDFLLIRKMKSGCHILIFCQAKKMQ